MSPFLMTIDLKTATPEQIDAAVAEHGAGWKYGQTTDVPGWLTIAPDGKESWGANKFAPPFSTSADAVLPLIQRCY
jgi:hypothetical protein